MEGGAVAALSSPHDGRERSVDGGLPNRILTML